MNGIGRLGNCSWFIFFRVALIKIRKLRHGACDVDVHLRVVVSARWRWRGEGVADYFGFNAEGVCERTQN